MDETTDQRPAAWHAVFKLMLERNPSFSRSADTGQQCAINELERLYRIEASYALMVLRGAEVPPVLSEDK